MRLMAMVTVILTVVVAVGTDIVMVSPVAHLVLVKAKAMDTLTAILMVQAIKVELKQKRSKKRDTLTCSKQVLPHQTGQKRF
mgnify:CR=1 FL=1